MTKELHREATLLAHWPVQNLGGVMEQSGWGEGHGPVPRITGGLSGEAAKLY